MMDIDIDAMGIPGPEGHPMRPVEQRERKKTPYIRSEAEKSEKPEVFVQKRGPRWDLNPRGYEQEIAWT
jgi:hypothetical protein